VDLDASVQRIDMNALLARHVDVYLMYSATLNSADRDKDLLQGVGDPSLLSRLRYEFMADTDHTITPLAAQRRFIDKVLCWARAISDRQAAPMPMGAPAPRSDSRLAA